MSIYENSGSTSAPKAKPKRQPKSTSAPQAAKPKSIRNDKDLTALVKQIKHGPKSAKELLYDTSKEVIGVLQRDDEPFFFTDAQVKEFKQLQG